MKGAHKQMSWVRFSLAVVATSCALVIALFAIGALVVGSAFANGAQVAFGDHAKFNLPPELASLKDVPADQRFAHFKGVTANLTDKDGKPVTISVTPGVATSVSTSSLTINGNDGTSHTYTLDAQTFTRGTSPTTGQNVVVVTLNNSTTAQAVIAPNGDWNHGGPPFHR